MLHSRHMRTTFLWVALLASALSGTAAERKFDLNEFPVGQTPPGFRSLVAGEGKPGDWKILLDDVPSLMPALTPNAVSNTKRPVIAQLAQDATDEHFPMLVFDGESYGDFTLTTRFKIVGGAAEQMAGVAFRIQDEKNYYVIRASALGNNFRFYKFVNGQRSAPIGPDAPITTNVWHEIKVQCQGNQIICWLDGQALIPPLNDNSFSGGKVGLWTKSDSVTYFADTLVTFTPKEPIAQTVVRDLLVTYPRLRGLKIVAPKKEGDAASMIVVGSKDEADLKQPAAEVHQNAYTREAIFYAKGKENVSVVMPLRDRNGETIGAAELTMESFLGQTEQNALARAIPIVKAMQARIQSAKDLTP